MFRSSFATAIVAGIAGIAQFASFYGGAQIPIQTHYSGNDVDFGLSSRRCGKFHGIPHRASGAAAIKRAARKRRNIRRNASKRRGVR